MKRTTAEKMLDELYAQVPAMVDCKGLCSRSCGPIACSKTEKRRVQKRAGRKLAAPDMTCSMLSMVGRCTVYGDRPMICRLWGAVEDMPCPWGCRPQRMLSAREGRELLARSLQAGGGVAS